MRFIFQFSLLVALIISPMVAQETIKLAADIDLIPLTPSIWQHVTYQEMPEWGKVPANGLIVISGTEAILIDTPWTPQQTAIVLDWLQKEKGVTVTLAIPCHSHEDCLGGLPEIHQRGITSIGLDKTKELALSAKIEAPKETFTGSRHLKLGNRELEVFYPGAGHTVDNIVVWLADEKVLFGGCLIKAIDAQNMGNIAESDLAAWPDSLRAVKARYPGARIVVPGHGEAGGLDLIDHSLELLKKN